jgi:protein-S-isoprenylcysteine O-methyltransferase Ste14
MPGYVALGVLCGLIVLVLVRVRQLRRVGIAAFRFGAKDKRDFLIPPFVLLFFYLVVAGAFDLPTLGWRLWDSPVVGWIGVAVCALGAGLFIAALVTFGRSFRVGLDEDHPGELVTTGAFALSRNPIYTAFAIILCGVFLIVANWVILIYLVAAVWLFNRQIRLEEASLTKVYGQPYLDYCRRVRRFL